MVVNINLANLSDGARRRVRLNLAKLIFTNIAAQLFTVVVNEVRLKVARQCAKIAKGMSLEYI